MALSRPATCKGERRTLISWKLRTAVFALLTHGCSELPVTLEVLTWWQEGSETKAWNELVVAHAQRRPEVEVQRDGRPTGEGTRALIGHRMLLGDPPSTFQANIGSDLLRWIAVDYMQAGTPVRERRITDLSSFYDARKLRGSFHPRLLMELGVSGDPFGPVYGVPLNIHRLNLLYYNVELTKSFQSDGMDFTEDLGVLCPEQPAPALTPAPTIAIGLRSPFTLTLLTFENVLPALNGADFYQRLWRGESSPEFDAATRTNGVRSALKCVQHLFQFFHRDYPALDWSEAADLVDRGEATFTVMGDWVNGRHADALREGSLASKPFPNTEDIFVFTADTFPLPYGALYREEVEELLETAASEPAQRKFSDIKGSIPARRDIVLEDPRGRATQEALDQAFDSEKAIMATSGLFPPYFPARELEVELEAMLGAGEAGVEKVIEWLETRYPLLSRWQSRLKDGPGELPQ